MNLFPSKELRHDHLLNVLAQLPAPSPKLAEALYRWIAHLKSGEFRQGTRALMSPAGFCCLGVLYATTQDRKALVCASKEELETASLRAFHESCGRGPISEDLEVLLSFLERNPHDPTRSRTVAIAFASFNDIGGTFDEIASAIQEYLTKHHA